MLVPLSLGDFYTVNKFDADLELFRLFFYKVVLSLAYVAASAFDSSSLRQSVIFLTISLCLALNVIYILLVGRSLGWAELDLYVLLFGVRPFLSSWKITFICFSSSFYCYEYGLTM